MQVALAGYNIDADHMALIRQIVYEAPMVNNEESTRFQELINQLRNEPLTPETLSAAYARISRSEKGVRELRRDARASVHRARKSNEKIVFGLGHASIAEHAVFNLDVTDASRLVLEELEAHRLASYTEASQRYIAMSGDYILPDEVISVGLKFEYEAVCQRLFEIYGKLVEALEQHHSGLEEQMRSSRAREDARYILPLACRSQVGMTVNARTAEMMVREFHESPLAEVRLMGKQILDALREVVPSLMRYVDPIPAKIAADKRLKDTATQILAGAASFAANDAILLSKPEMQELQAAAAILFRSGDASFESCLDVVNRMSISERASLIRLAHQHISEHDPLRREMELGYFTFVLSVSASAFAQLKRHRMSTIIKQSYQPELGVTVPKAIVDAGAERLFEEGIKRSEEFYHLLFNEFDDRLKPAAQYVLTNAHRRRVIFQANARELNHLARLRMDSHAQWDIRALAGKMIQLAREACPNLMLFAEGKETFRRMKADPQ